MYLHLPSTLKIYNMTQNTRNAFFFINWQAMCFAAVGRLYKLCIQIWLKHKHYKFFLLYFYFSCLNKQFVMSAHIRHTIFIFFFFGCQHCLQGCYDEVWQYLEHYINIVVGCVGGLAALEVRAILFQKLINIVLMYQNLLIWWLVLLI